MPEFRIVTGHGNTFTYDLVQDVIIIGRSKENQVALDDHTASREHVKLRKTPDGYLAMDMDSHNGTYVNGAKITKHVLKHNDLMKIGTSTLTFLEHSAGPVDLPTSETSLALEPALEEQVKTGSELLQSLPVNEGDTGQEQNSPIKALG